jgi:hypothetical protein
MAGNPFILPLIILGVTLLVGVGITYYIENRSLYGSDDDDDKPLESSKVGSQAVAPVEVSEASEASAVVPPTTSDAPASVAPAVVPGSPVAPAVVPGSPVVPAVTSVVPAVNSVEGLKTGGKTKTKKTTAKSTPKSKKPTSKSTKKPTAKPKKNKMLSTK